jgi:hypothetical protein
LFEARHQLASSATDRVDQPRLPLKGRVGLDKAIVQRAIAVEIDLDDTEARIDRLEQRPIAFLADPQRILGLATLMNVDDRADIARNRPSVPKRGDAASIAQR